MRHAGAGQLAARHHPDLAPRGAEGALAEPGAERLWCRREQPGKQVRRGREGHGLAQVRRGELTERGAGELAAEGQLHAQPLVVRRRESQQAFTDLHLTDPRLPAEDRVVALALREHERRRGRRSREEVHTSRGAT
jgi:hypothetical protein